MTGKYYHNKNNLNAQDKKVAVNKCIHFEQIDSTNTWAKTHLDQWATQGLTLVTASAQTAGRGRFSRRWESPPHVNIYATFCFWFEAQRKDRGLIPQILALAAAQTLEKKGFMPTIKWPNDLLLNGKKIVGILCETVQEGTRCGIVCGIGLNVNMSLDALNQIDSPATSLWVESGKVFDVAEILETLQQVFVFYLNGFIQKGFLPFFPLLQARSAFKNGQIVRFHDNQILLQARFKTLHVDGSIELVLPNGTSKVYCVGEFLN